MCKNKLFIKIIRFILILPALFIHELSHLITTLIMLKRPTAFVIRHNRFRHAPSGYVDMSEKDYKSIEKSFRFFFILIAPVLSVLVFLVLAFFHPLFIYISGYQLIFFRVSFLSDADLNKALKILGVKKEVHIPRLKTKTELYNWLYYDGLSFEKYFRQTEILFLESIENANQIDID